MAMPIDPLTRFSDRAENYARHRPGYPAALYAYLRREAALPPGAPIADVGSGTGLLSKLFLEQGHPVIGIEPNQAMRLAGERYLAGFSGFRSLDGRAEALPLEDASVDLLVAGQAFHWFDATPFRREAQRVLRPDGHAALIWNRRDTEDPFVKDYNQLLEELAVDYRNADPEYRLEGLAQFLGPEAKSVTFPNPLSYNLPALRGLALSQSYVPLPDHPNHAPFFERLEAIFYAHHRAGAVTLPLVTHLHHAPLRPHA